MSQLNPQSTSTPQHSSANASGTAERAQLELAAISLISQLELQFEKSFGRSDHVENASGNSDKILTQLLDFSDKHLSEESAAKALQQIKKASFAGLIHKEALDTLSWGFAISNLFGKSVNSDARVSESYKNLGDALLTACVSVLREAVAAAGTGSQQAETIEQSTAVLVEEFKSSW